MKHRLLPLLLCGLVAALVLTACRQDRLPLPSDGAEAFVPGQTVDFRTLLHGHPAPRTVTANPERVQYYTPLADDYRLKVEMLKKDNGDTPTVTGTATYTAPYSTAPEAVNTGTLQADEGTAPLYWPDNTTAYAFRATAGTAAVAADQTDRAKWLEQDRIEGYAYLPLTDDSKEGDDKGTDDPDGPNYRTNKEWRNDLRTWLGADKEEADYRRIPLFLRHRRAWISIVLKADEGVEPNDLKLETAPAKISAHIYSYPQGQDAVAVEPWLRGEQVTYPLADGGTVTLTTARYEAIVDPHDYLAQAEDQVLCTVNVSGQKFSYYAGNDTRYADYKNGVTTAVAAMQEAYRLEAGKHLTLEVTLSRASRKILITAHVEDWEEQPHTYTCDDYGSNGDPIVLTSRDALKRFLADSERNKPGNMAILGVPAIDLDRTDEGTANTWDAEQILHCTLNLGGCAFTGTTRFLKEVGTSGSLINGSFHLTGTVDAAICQTNRGNLSYLSVSPAEPGTAEVQHASATRAGLTVDNHGSISRCRSSLTVIGKTDGGTTPHYIGGIAARSVYSTDTQMPIIEQCEVTAGVRQDPNDTSTNVRGGGIAGWAEGRVSGCTFEFGITLLQNTESDVRMRNIVCEQGTNDLKAYGNEWPTRALNEIGSHETKNSNVREASLLYDATIGNQPELAALVAPHSAHNTADKLYRISEDFTVHSDNWELGAKSDDRTNASRGNVLFTLDGNGHTITQDGTKAIEYRQTENGPVTETFITAPMLFINIMGRVHDLNLYCAKSLYGIPIYEDKKDEHGTSIGANQSLDICAPLGYAVIGGSVERVNVRSAAEACVQAALAGGLVVWAYDGATLTDCTSQIDVRLYFAQSFGTDARRYAGGVAAEAADATFIRCRYRPNSSETTLKDNLSTPSENVFYGGIVGGVGIKDQDGGGSYTPDLTLVDCSSWYTCELPAGATHGEYPKGSVIGRTRYVPKATTGYAHGMNAACEGNWWPLGSIGAGNWLSGYTEERAIGKRNAVTPSFNEESY